MSGETKHSVLLYSGCVFVTIYGKDPVGAKRSSTGRAAPRYGCVFFLDLKKPSCAICIVNFVTAPKELFINNLENLLV